MMKYLFLALLAVSFVGCAFDKKENKEVADNLRNYEDLSRQYNRVKGTYKGQLSLRNSVQEVRLEIFVLDVQDGTNSDGSPRYRPTLRGNYDRLNPVGTGYKFEGQVIDSPREGIIITFTNVDAKMQGPGTSSIGPDDIHTMKLTMEGQNLRGDASSTSGFIGTFNLTLVTKESEKPGGGDNQEQEYYDRLFEQYKLIAGKYIGQNVKEGQKAYNLILNIQVAMVNNGKVSVPQIMGTMDRSDDPAGTTRLILTVNYQPELTPPRLTFTGKPRDFAGSDYTAYFVGSLKDGVYSGSWTTNKTGFEGNFELKKDGVKPKEEEKSEGQGKSGVILPPADKVPVPTPRPKR